MKRWEQRITLRSLRIADRFINFELRFLLRLRVKHSGEVWVACLEPIGRADHGHPVSHEQVIVSDGKQCSVLVDIVELVDSPKRLISALVRLQVVDVFYCQWPHALYFSRLLGFVGSKILRNWKFDTPSWLVARTNKDKLVCKVVKSTSEVVDEIPCDGERIEGQNWEIDEMLRHLPRSRIAMGANYIETLVPGGEEFCLQVTEVFFGPLNFHANENEPIQGI